MRFTLACTRIEFRDKKIGMYISSRLRLSRETALKDLVRLHERAKREGDLVSYEDNVFDVSISGFALSWYSWLLVICGGVMGICIAQMLEITWRG